MRPAVLVALVLLGNATARAEEALPYPAGLSEQVIDERKVTLRIPAAAPTEKRWGFVLAVGGTIEHLAGLSADEYVVCLASPRLDKAGTNWSGGEIKELWALVDHLTEGVARRSEADARRRDGTEHLQHLRGHGVRRRQPLRERDLFRTPSTGAGRSRRGRRRRWACWRTSGSPRRGDGVNRMPGQLGGKVRSIELRDDEKGLSGAYFPWWIRADGGALRPGRGPVVPVGGRREEHGRAQAARGAEVASRARVRVRGEDASSPDAKALHLETFLDDRVRRAGRALLLSRSTAARRPSSPRPSA